MKLNSELYNRVVVKVGTLTLTYDSGMINLRKIENLVKCLADLRNRGKQVILVSSGAVGCGLAKIGFSPKIKLTTEQKQAAAAVGQCQLINIYDRLFSDYGHKIAQVLLTKDIMENEACYSNAKNTIKLLIGMQCVPIVNENDTVSSEQLNFGSNDTLSSFIAILSDADLLINMSDVDGFFTKNPYEHPDAALIERVDEITPEIRACAGGTITARGTGGMVAKLEAAQAATEKGIPMLIVNGNNPGILYDIFEKEFKGTLFTAGK